MTNVGLEKIFGDNLIGLIRAPVGDRYVKEEMLKRDLNLGGEQSGHIILKDFTSSGDGIVIALQVLSILSERNIKVSKLLNIFEPIPQKLMNFKVSSQDVLNMENTKKFLSDCNDEIQNHGRIVARMSGTEPLLRVMIECKEQNKLNELSSNINNHFSKL